jgi:hypothetical protein
MKETLATLHRVRETLKKGAQLEHVAAERKRMAQQERVDEIRESMDRLRSGDRNASNEACWLAQEQAYRLRMQVQLRRENAVLNKHSIEVEKRQSVLRQASRDARVVELVMERLDVLAETEKKRSEARRIDDLATSRWRSKKSA